MTTKKEESLIGIVEVSKQEARLLVESGYLHIELGKFKEAQEIFEGCAALLPRSDVPRIGLGNLFFSQGRHDDAINAYQDAIKVRPDSAAAHAFLGEAYLFKKQFAKAQDTLKRAQELEPEGPPAELARNLLKAYEQGAFNA